MPTSPITTLRLDETLRAVCPIVSARMAAGVGSYDPDPSATGPQIAAANAALAAFDYSQVADDAWLAARNPERKTLRDAAAQAVADIDTYLAVASPTNAQVVAQVRRLSQQMRAVVRRLVQLD